MVTQKCTLTKLKEHTFCWKKLYLHEIEGNQEGPSVRYEPPIGVLLLYEPATLQVPACFDFSQEGDLLLPGYHWPREPTFVTCLYSSTYTLPAFQPGAVLFQLTSQDLMQTVLVLLSHQSHLIPLLIPGFWTCLEGIFRLGLWIWGGGTCSPGVHVAEDSL